MSLPAQRSTARPTPDLFDVLAHTRRRHTLAVLREADRPLAMGDLAREVAAREQDESIDALDAETVRECGLALHHAHVPKLAHAELVVHDRDRGTVEYDADAGAEDLLSKF